MTERYIYKIYTQQEWEERAHLEAIPGNPKDERSGFIHASSGEQAGLILGKYYSDSETVVLRLDTEKLDNVVWEFNKNAVYPHLYSSEGEALTFPKSAVDEIIRLQAGETFEFANFAQNDGDRGSKIMP